MPNLIFTKIYLSEKYIESNMLRTQNLHTMGPRKVVMVEQVGFQLTLFTLKLLILTIDNTLSRKHKDVELPCEDLIVTMANS
jgi:hypothetical protein